VPWLMERGRGSRAAHIKVRPVSLAKQGQETGMAGIRDRKVRCEGCASASDGHPLAWPARAPRIAVAARTEEARLQPSP